MIQTMDLKLGIFHGVIGVAVGEDNVAILDRNHVERLIPISPAFNPEPLPVAVSGEFGSFEHVQGGVILEGIEPKGITAIEITKDFQDPDFHTRILRLKSASGLNLTWELYCDN